MRSARRSESAGNQLLWVADPEALQAASDRLSEEVLRKRLDYWTFALGPKFSEKERARVKRFRRGPRNRKFRLALA